VLCRQLQQVEGRTDVASELVQHLLRSALHPEQPEGAAAMDLLLELPAAEQLPAGQILQLLLAVVRVEATADMPCWANGNESEQVNSHWDASTVQELSRLPGSWDIQEHDMLQLLHVAVENQPLLLPMLLKMPSAQQLTPQAVLQLLQLTLAGAHKTSTGSCTGSRYSCVQQLLQLVPRKRSQQEQEQRMQCQKQHSTSISPARLGRGRLPRRYLQETSGADCLPVASPAAKRQPHLVLTLHPAPAVQPAHSGPSVQQLLQPEQAASLVRAALHSRDMQILQAFCRQLQQLRQLKSDAVRALLQEAVDVGSWDALRVMRSSLPGAVQVMGAGLVEGLQEPRKLHGDCHT
jgi:hypothetical protein